MNDASTNPQDPRISGLQYIKAMLFEGLKGKRISYLTLPLFLMATVTEFVILATGWKYQQRRLRAPGHGRHVLWHRPDRRDHPGGGAAQAAPGRLDGLAHGLAKRVSCWSCGLPLICVLTFQLVKDMAVYEMGVAMTPASQMLEKASAEEIKIVQLNGELAAIEGKKVGPRTASSPSWTAKQGQGQGRAGGGIEAQRLMRGRTPSP